MRRSIRIRGMFLALAWIAVFGPLFSGSSPARESGQSGPRWVVSKKGTVLEICYGSGAKTPQYGALHLDSSYLRLVAGSDSHWGTSLIILPSFWQGGVLYQGAPVTAKDKTSGGDLILTLTGRISTLQVEAEVKLIPPFQDLISAVVSVQVRGNVVLDKRPGEAFKLVTLSSMHCSTRNWDCQKAWTGSLIYPIPGQGWIIANPARDSDFGLQGGTSAWKKNAPTIAVRLDRKAEITGWVTRSSDPNDDNVGFWGASDRLVRSWRYLVIARK